MGINVRQNIVTNGLVLYLDAGNRVSYVSGSTTWRDVSGNNYTGSLINGPTFTNANQGGIVLDGTNDYVETPVDENIVSTSSGSIDFVYRLNSTPTANFSKVWSFLSTNFLWYENNEITNPSPVMRWVWRYSDTTLDTISSGISFSDLSIYHITLTYALSAGSTTFRFYRNGALFSSTTAAKTLSTTTKTPLRFGSHTGAGAFANCTMYNYKIYNRTLSDAEVVQNYNATKNRFGLT